MFGGKDKTEALLQGALFGLQRNGKANLLRKYGACFKQRGPITLCSAQRDLYGSSLRSSLKMTMPWCLMREITTSAARNDRETKEIATSAARNDSVERVVIAKERSDCGNLLERVTQIAKRRIHYLKEFFLDSSPAAQNDDASVACQKEITTSGIRPPRNDSAETREIATAIKNRLVMTSLAFALALVLNLAPISEVLAKSDCAVGEQNCWDCGKTEADLCTARLNTSTKALSITGSGEMRDYQGEWNGTPQPIFNNPWGIDYNTVSIQGIKNIGERALNYSYISSVNIDDTVSEIGKHAFLSCFSISQIIISDSVTDIGDRAFFNAIGLQKLVIGNSVNSIGESAFNGVGGLIYCPSNINCGGKGSNNITYYTKDSDGVYKIGNNYYASPEDMVANRVCGSGTVASQACIDAAKAYQDQKAESMAGGALCATKQSCLKLLDMANKKDVCTSIADCANYNKDCSKQGKVVYKGECMEEYPFARKHWTPSEAAKWLNDDDNDVILTFKK